MNARFDYHGWKLHEALSDIERHVSAVREKRECRDVELITGHGIIQQEAIRLLKSYGLNPTIKLGNSGIIVCEIE